MLILNAREAVCLSGKVWGLWSPLVWATASADNRNVAQEKHSMRCLALLVEGVSAQANFTLLDFEWGDCWELPMFQIVL